MKRFIILSLCMVALCAGTASFASADVEKNVVKTELAVSVDIDSIDVLADALLVKTFSTDYIAEETLDVIPYWTPRVIGNTLEGSASKVYHPPTIVNKHSIPFSRRS